jgi:hypothetical protein
MFPESDHEIFAAEGVRVFKDALKAAREGASYVLWRRQTIHGPVMAVLDGDRICCIDAGSQRARKMLVQCPSAVAGVYGTDAKREQIIDDLLIVLRTR